MYWKWYKNANVRWSTPAAIVSWSANCRVPVTPMPKQLFAASLQGFRAIVLAVALLQAALHPLACIMLTCPRWWQAYVITLSSCLCSAHALAQSQNAAISATEEAYADQACI